MKFGPPLARQVRWIARSLPRRTALALAVAVGAVILFVDIAEDVFEKETDAIDQAIAVALHRLDSPAADAVMRGATLLGSALVVLPVVAVVAAWALWRGQRGLAGVLVAIASVAEGLNVLLKHLFRRERPTLFLEIPVPESFSFPSGHAMVAAAAYGMTAVVLARLRPGLRVAMSIVAPAFILLVGASRVYLGVHWPTDVVAGFSAGIFILIAGLLALGRAGKPVEG